MSVAQAALVFLWISSENLPNLANFVKGIRDCLFYIGKLEETFACSILG